MSSSATVEQPPAAMPGIKVPARTKTGTNWTGAFLLYAKGMLLQEVAKEMGIDLNRLKLKSRTEDWDNLIMLNRQLAVRAPGADVSPQSAVVLKDVVQRIEANREEALKVAQGLRANIQKILLAYESGNQFLQVADIAKLAGAARSIDECAMLALGDDPAPKIAPNAGAPVEQKPAGPVTHFHIHPPAQAVGPRRQKVVEPVVEVGGRQVDAVFGHSTDPAHQRVEMQAVGSDVDDDPVVETGLGRSTMDFKKLAREVGAVKLPVPKVRIPEFARAS
jgi:hypothetical protein